MPSNKYDIEMNQGDTFAINLTVKNASGSLKDLTNYSARMQMRSSYNSTTVVESLSTANGEISINTISSTMSLNLPATRTAAIPVDLGAGKPPRSTYVYDLELVNGDDVSKLVYGNVTVYGEVTR